MKALLLAPALFLAAPATAQPAPPYKASGTEPFWSLTIDAREIAFRPMEGRPIRVAKPRPIVGINGELYRTKAMTVDITHVRCSDGMSDRTFADTVKVTIGRRTLSGCGGAAVATGPTRPVDNLLSGTRWRIDMVDGRRVTLQANATVRFTDERVEGRICNNFGGSYAFRRGTLTAGPLAATRMFCAGTTGQVEAAFLRLMTSPVKVSQGNRDTLVLTSGRQRVTLRRLK